MVTKIRILLVDDHWIVREGLKSVIDGQEGMEVVGEADNGLDAVKLAGRLGPDVVIMDMTMPELNGMEATGEIVAANPRTRILILSMHRDKARVSRALKQGASGYLDKACAFDELEKAIRTVVAGRTYLSPSIADVVLTDYRQRIASEGSPLDILSSREREVLQMIAEGHHTKDIATRLNLSSKTIETHRSQVMAKLDLRNVADLTRFAIREGLLRLE